MHESEKIATLYEPINHKNSTAHCAPHFQSHHFSAPSLQDGTFRDEKKHVNRYFLSVSIRASAALRKFKHWELLIEHIILMALKLEPASHQNWFLSNGGKREIHFHLGMFYGCSDKLSRLSCGNWNSIANCVPFPLTLSHFPSLLSNHFEFPDNFRFPFVGRRRIAKLHSMKINKACKSSTCSEAEILHFYCFYYVTSCSASMCAKKESVEHYVSPQPRLSIAAALVRFLLLLSLLLCFMKHGFPS